MKKKFFYYKNYLLKMHLCYDVIIFILKYNESYKSKFHLINKELNEVFNKKKYHESQLKIKKWYKNTTYPYSMEVDWYELSKINIVQYYKKYYELRFLLKFPNFLARKLHRNDLIDYISNNMNPIIENRTKLEVIQFLNLSSVSKRDILIAGW